MAKKAPQLRPRAWTALSPIGSTAVSVNAIQASAVATPILSPRPSPKVNIKLPWSRGAASNARLAPPSMKGCNFDEHGVVVPGPRPEISATTTGFPGRRIWCYPSGVWQEPCFSNGNHAAAGSNASQCAASSEVLGSTTAAVASEELVYTGVGELAAAVPASRASLCTIPGVSLTSARRQVSPMSDAYTRLSTATWSPSTPRQSSGRPAVMTTTWELLPPSSQLGSPLPQLNPPRLASPLVVPLAAAGRPACRIGGRARAYTGTISDWAAICEQSPQRSPRVRTSR